MKRSSGSVNKRLVPGFRSHMDHNGESETIVFAFFTSHLIHQALSLPPSGWFHKIILTDRAGMDGY